MPTRKAQERAAELREQAKTDPALALTLRRKRIAARKAAAARAAKAAAAVRAEPSPEKAAADAAEHELLDTIQARQPDPRAAGLVIARAALAEKRATGEFVSKGKPRHPMTPDERTFTGRIDMLLMKLGKSRYQFENEVRIPNSSVARWKRFNQRPRADRMAQIAEYLGVTVEWLRDGGVTPEPAALVPHAATVFKANGKHHPSHEGRIEAAMQANVDTTITALWSLLPMDAKVMVIARVAELIAQRK